MSALPRLYAVLARDGLRAKIHEDGWCTVRQEVATPPAAGERAVDVVMRMRGEGWRLIEDRSRGELRRALEATA